MTLAGLAACGVGGESTSESNRDEVTLGVIPIVDVAPVYLGKERNFFRDEGIDLTIKTSQGGAAVVPSVLSGDFQFGFSGVTSLFIAADKGVPLRVVAPGNASTGVEGKDFCALLVQGNSEITDASDLEGKTVAINTLNNIGDTTVRQSVRKAGGDPSKVKFVELAFPDMAAALAAGRVDAIWTVEPFLTIAKEQGARVIAWPHVDTAPDLMVAAYFTTAELAESDPELVERFTAAMEHSLRYASENPDEARAALGTYTDISPEIAAALTLPAWPEEINKSSIEVMSRLALEGGLVSKEVDLPELFPTAY